MRIPRKIKKANKKAILAKTRSENALCALQTLVLLEVTKHQARLIQSQIADPAVKLIGMANLTINFAQSIQKIYA
jgi:hypothetical protein